jgi:hypothetical protein
MLPPRRPWTFRGLRAASSDGDEEAERGALQQRQPAPTGNPFASVAAVLAAPGSWSAGVWAAVVVGTVVVLGGAGVGIAAGMGAFDPEESSTSTATDAAADALPVTVQPMGYYATSSAARIRGAGPVSVQTCPDRRSTVTCPDTDGNDVDITASSKYEWISAFGEGYVDAFGGCSHAGASMTTPYANSHAGGMMVDEYANIAAGITQDVDNYIAGVSSLNSIADMIHSGAIAHTCGADGYLANPDQYTCGLQFLNLGGGFPGDACKTLIDGGHAFATGSKYWEASSGLSTHFTEFDAVCFDFFGRLEMFPVLKAYLQSGAADAWLAVSFDLTMGITGSFVPGTLGALHGVTFAPGTTCTATMMIGVGSPTCADPTVALTATLHGPGTTPVDDALRAGYGLDRYGFKYDAVTQLWHVAGTGEDCALGCCDACFQRHCSAPDQCVAYSYDCYNYGQATTHANSADQSCGAQSASGVDRIRC